MMGTRRRMRTKEGIELEVLTLMFLLVCELEWLICLSIKHKFNGTYDGTFHLL